MFRIKRTRKFYLLTTIVKLKKQNYFLEKHANK